MTCTYIAPWENLSKCFFFPQIRFIRLLNQPILNKSQFQDADICFWNVGWVFAIVLYDSCYWHANDEVIWIRGPSGESILNLKPTIKQWLHQVSICPSPCFKNFMAYQEACEGL